MKPSLGRIVIVHMDPTANNGATEAPAMISRVWTDTMVNVRILVDGSNEVLSRTSVNLFDTQEEAVASGGTYHAWWPAKV